MSVPRVMGREGTMGSGDGERAWVGRRWIRHIVDGVPEVTVRRCVVSRGSSAQFEALC